MKHRILLIDDEVALLGTMRQILEKQGYDIITAHSGIEAMGIVKREIENLSLVLTDLLMPGGFDGIDLMEAVHQLDADIPVIVITAYGNVETAVKAMQKGAFNFLTKPVNYKVLLQQIEKAAETLSLREENKRLRREIASLQEDRYRIVHASEKMRRLLESAVEIAKTDETVLITGESGTGKELVARHILNESPRARRPFVAFNAAAVHPNLIESELFGFKKGAFTGADRNSPGYVGAAEGGTLFIDEIGEMPTALQPKLLRFMQEREYPSLL
ncbi:MAG TPA: sigma-54 dependent transcriptional regulator, partial [bacterium]|nr:sigma-54 dependent transcriptional regulator [bacterium]